MIFHIYKLVVNLSNPRAFDNLQLFLAGTGADGKDEGRVNGSTINLPNAANHEDNLRD